MPLLPIKGSLGNRTGIPVRSEARTSDYSCKSTSELIDKPFLRQFTLGGDPDGLSYKQLVAWTNLAGDPGAKSAIDRSGRRLERSLCGQHVVGGWEVEHYPIPRSHGGPDIEANWMATGLELDTSKNS